MLLGRRQARMIETRSGRLGVIEPGKRGLILIPDNQDLRVVTYSIRGLRERGADADYMYSADLLEMYGYPRSYADERSFLDPIKNPNLSITVDGIQRYNFKESHFSKEVWAQVPSPELIEITDKKWMAKTEALRRYLENHPEYDYIFLEWWGDAGERHPVIQRAFGRKLQFGWRIRTMQAFIGEVSQPQELRRVLEQKGLEIIPWIRHVQVTDPEGTDIGFSISEEDANYWRMGAFQVGGVRLWPLVAARWLPTDYGIDKTLAPDATGTLAATFGHDGAVIPHIKLNVEHGRVVGVEGGGLQGLLLRDLVNRNKDFHIPFFPYPGWAYVDHGGISVDIGGATSIDWGIGAETRIAETVEYMIQHNMPLFHMFHMFNQFPTYEATVTGGKKIKIIDKGRATFFRNDPEIRAIASKYGDPDQILSEEGNILPMPGINVAGDYWTDYAQDPNQYWLKDREERRNGTSPYLRKVPLPSQLTDVAPSEPKDRRSLGRKDVSQSDQPKQK